MCMYIEGWEYTVKNRVVNRKFYEAVRLPVPPSIPSNSLLTAEAYFFLPLDRIKWKVVKNPHASAGDTGDVVLIPRWGRSPGGRN